jgi:5'-nucleotidase
MKFLLTNDDGIDAPGIRALAEAVTGLGEVIVVAPELHHSGCGHLTTTSRPLELKPRDDGRYALDGSPVDCTRVGLTHVAPAVEWVLSGINEGGNLGADVYASGTVAAAREACLLGRHAIAISQYVRRRPIDWQLASRWTRHVVELLLEQPPGHHSLWNVNLPQPLDAGDAMPACVFCDVDPHPLPVRFEMLDGKLHYRAAYRDRRRTTRHDVEKCFAGQITISKITLPAIPT